MALRVFHPGKDFPNYISLIPPPPLQLPPTLSAFPRSVRLPPLSALLPHFLPAFNSQSTPTLCLERRHGMQGCDAGKSLVCRGVEWDHCIRWDV